MGIIGIVSALTLPNLNSSTGEKEKVAKLKKIYQNLNDAVGRSAAVYGPIDDIKAESSAEAIAIVGDRLTEFMKVSKNCGISTNQGCFSNGHGLYHYLDVNSEDDNNFDKMSISYKFILADGTSIAIVGSVYGIFVFVNLDGPTQKTVLGRNTFSFLYDYDGSNCKDEIVTRYSSHTDEDTLDACLDNIWGCADWVIQNGNLDYLKTDENGKCPNGKVLNYTTNTTCK